MRLFEYVGKPKQFVIHYSSFREVLLHDPQKTKMHLPTNCAFGGPGLTDLYIAHLKLDHFCKVSYGAKGHPLYHQR